MRSFWVRSVINILSLIGLLVITDAVSVGTPVIYGFAAIIALGILINQPLPKDYQ